MATIYDLYTSPTGFVLEIDGNPMDVSSYVLGQFQSSPGWAGDEDEQCLRDRLPSDIGDLPVDPSAAADQLAQVGEVLQVLTAKLLELTETADVFMDWDIPTSIRIWSLVGEDYSVFNYGLVYFEPGEVRGTTFAYYPDGSEVVLQDIQLNQVLSQMGIE